MAVNFGRCAPKASKAFKMAEAKSKPNENQQVQGDVSQAQKYQMMTTFFENTMTQTT